MRNKVTPLEQRLWRRVEYGGTGCWLWTGAKARDGCGMITIGQRPQNRTERVPRVVWWLIHGTYPRLACHHCDTPACCRPSHIYDGTPLSNMRDMIERGRKVSRWGGVHGERSPMAKLRAVDVPVIRERRARGERLQSIADDYGVTTGAIGAIVMGRSWKRAH